MLQKEKEVNGSRKKFIDWVISVSTAIRSKFDNECSWIPITIIGLSLLAILLVLVLSLCATKNSANQQQLIEELNRKLEEEVERSEKAERQSKIEEEEKKWNEEVEANMKKWPEAAKQMVKKLGD